MHAAVELDLPVSLATVLLLGADPLVRAWSSESRQFRRSAWAIEPIVQAAIAHCNCQFDGTRRARRDGRCARESCAIACQVPYQ